MTERQAIFATLISMGVLEIVAVLGLYALGASGVTVSLGVILPLVLAGYLMARIVLHYSEEHPQR